MRSILVQSGLATALILTTLPAATHHSAAIYDRERNITFRGVVTRFQWANPHVYIDVEAENDGEKATWVVEGQPPAVMSKRGWSAESLAPGDLISITARPTIAAGRQLVQGLFVVKSDGERLGISAPSVLAVLGNPEASYVAADGLSGNWVTRLDSEVYRRFFERQPSSSLTGKGNAAVESYDRLADVNAPGCTVYPPPYIMVVPLMTQIAIGDPVTSIRFEASAGPQGVVGRSVYMNAESHDGASYSSQGHSIGWWEDDVLVVDTTHYSNNPLGHGRGLPSGPGKHSIERFKLNEDRTVLDYTFWVEDPEYLAEVATGSLELLYRPDLEFVDLPCDTEIAHRYLDD
jgi:hypothetical protein